MTRRSPPDAIKLITALLPSLITLIGVGGLKSTGIVDIRDRYQWAADVLVWTSLAGIAMAIAVASYPFVHERPFSLAAGMINAKLHDFADRRAFRDWSGRWHEYTALVLSNSLPHKRRDDWNAAQGQYAAIRNWLVSHEAPWQSSVAEYARGHLASQWGRLSLCDGRIDRKNAFFKLYGALDFDTQMLAMVEDSASAYYSNPSNHDVSATFRGLWDALNRYGLSRGWGSFRSLDEA